MVFVEGAMGNISSFFKAKGRQRLAVGGVGGGGGYFIEIL